MKEHRIVLCKDKCQKDSEFWQDVSKISDVLTKHGYDVLFKYDDVGVYYIQYNYNSYNDFGENRFMSVTEQEQQKILQERKNCAEENHQDE